MATSRLRKVEERELKKRLFFMLVGTIGILTFLGVFGLKILVSFSLLVDKIRGNTPAAKQGQAIILPPSLNPLPEATNSALVAVSGLGQSGYTLILYVNEKDTKKIPVPKDGNFSINDVAVQEGTNIISAKLTDDHGNTSDLSNVISVSVKRTPPTLEVSSPAENTTIYGDKNTVTVAGTVKDDSTTVTVNGRFAVVSSNGTFSYDAALNNGSNTLAVVASDAAGNQITVERHVTYQR